MERHRFDVLSFAFGVVFLALAATTLVDDVDLALLETRWILPGILIALGLAVLYAAVPVAGATPADPPEEPADGGEDFSDTERV